MNKWQRAGGQIQLQMMGAVSRVIKENQLSTCPSCSNHLHFYYHEFGLTPRRTGTIWIWCDRCHIWDHVSRVELPTAVVYKDPFNSLSIHEFGSLERKGLLDILNKMAANDELPKTFIKL